MLTCEHHQTMRVITAAPNVRRLAGRVWPRLSSAADSGVVCGAAEAAADLHRAERVSHHLQLFHKRRVHVGTPAAAFARQFVRREVGRCAWVPLAHLPTPFARSNER